MLQASPFSTYRNIEISNQVASFICDDFYPDKMTIAVWFSVRQVVCCGWTLRPPPLETRRRPARSAGRPSTSRTWCWWPATAASTSGWAPFVSIPEDGHRNCDPGVVSSRDRSRLHTSSHVTLWTSTTSCQPICRCTFAN